MADVNSLMTFGMSAEVAKAVVADSGVDDLIRLGVAPELAKAIVANEASADRLMALGLPAALATDVVAIITA